jgi:hypothetical protein
LIFPEYAIHLSIKEPPVQKNRINFALIAAAIALIPACGIPTSMPILPKEVVIKANPSVSMPLGQVNYSLYSGLSGGNMNGRKGSLDDILGASWLEDLLEQGIALYDYRPSEAEDDGTQIFLVHYRLDMEDSLGRAGELDLNEYREMIEELTGTPTAIDDVSFEIPSMNVTELFDVTIPLGEVTQQIDDNLGSLQFDTAYLPVVNGSSKYEFPYDLSQISENVNKDFSVTLQGLEALTIKKGILIFEFTLRYGTMPPAPPLGPGSKLELSGFQLKPDINSNPIPNVKVIGNGSVTLDSDGDTGKLSIDLSGAELPQKFDLVCSLAITGNGYGFFDLDVKPRFEDDFIISGARALELSDAQLASLAYTFQMTHPVGGDLGPSFNATVGTGNLEIDIAELFPPLKTAGPNDEGWDLELDLSGLEIRQDPALNPHPINTIKGLSLGGPGQPLHSGDNDLKGKTLNYNPVIIDGKATVSIPKAGDGKRKLTFRIPEGIPDVYGPKQVVVRMDVSRLSEVKVKAADFGLDRVDQEIDQDLGDDFSAFRDWLNYIQFERTAADPPDSGLGLVLDIETLSIVGGLGLYINAPAFGLTNIFQPLENSKGQESAKLIFTSKSNDGSGGYTLRGKDLPDQGEPLHITVKLGMKDPAAQKLYEDTGIMTMKDVEPGSSIVLQDAVARLLFDWTKMSVKPRPHTNEEDSDDPLPTYPFAGTFPDEEGIDLSDMPKGLGFYIPDEAKGEAGKGLDARLYIGLKRQSLNEDGEWVDDPENPGSVDDPYEWGKNLVIKLPNLDFRFKYSDDTKSDNLFTYEQNSQKDTGEWTFSSPLEKIMKALEDTENPELDGPVIMEDPENKANPFKLYTSSSLPEEDKAIPLGNFAEAFNEALIGGKEGPLYFEYTVELANVPGENEGTEEPGEILLYPEMLRKKIVFSVDLLLIIPLKFQANPDAGEGVPVVMTIDPDLGDEDLFGREGPDDNEFFDMVTSFGFDLAIKNVAGLSAGKFFLENKSDVKKLKYRLPLLDFANPHSSNFFLDSGEMEKIKSIWPFIPQVALEFTSGDVVRIERNFNIELQSITVKADGEYTFETGL